MGRGRGFRGFVVALVALGTLAFAPGAEAAITEVFDGEATGGGAISCTEESDGVRFCGGPDTTVDSFDEVPIDVNLALPPEPTSGPDGNFPLIGIFHGWGGQESTLNGMRRFLDQGYAVFSMSDRGWDYSCGKDRPTRFLEPICQTTGYNRLMDTRYEVRDAQDFYAALVDEGVVDPDRLGSSGGSYGGGLSMALAALNDRQMMPDGSLVAWKSPVKGTPLSLAAAIPEIPWTDLAYSLVPNGGTLDYTEDSDYFKRG
ncbi:MAG: acetylxylan esterase, partial [Solirubrobacterales bacterium]